MTTQTFDDLGLSTDILTALHQKGFKNPTDIQAMVIPALVAKPQDIIALAQTGTGKTAAYGLPLLHHLDPSKTHIQSIILAPTRELAIQVAKELDSFKPSNHLKVTTVVGGQSMDLQIRSLSKKPAIVVGTPGRVIDLIQRKKLNTSQVSTIILDEADEMLKQGFQEDVEIILQDMPTSRRMWLFSATMPNSVKYITKKYMSDPLEIQTKAAKQATTQTDQWFYEVNQRDKLSALYRILDYEHDIYGIIFCKTKKDVDDVTEKLILNGYKAEGLHGDLTQGHRNRILMKFRERVCRILVATDVAARGLDINDLSHVINFAIPQDSELYVHRIGRTGRAGKTGKAISLVSPSEFFAFKKYQKQLSLTVRKERLPSVDDIRSRQQSALVDRITQNVGGPLDDAAKALMKNMLDNHSATDAVAALSQWVISKEFQSKKYSSVDDLYDQQSRRPNRENRRKESFSSRSRRAGSRRRFQDDRSGNRPSGQKKRFFNKSKSKKK